MTASVAVVVLAAGASRRLGAPKQLVRCGGQTLLTRAVEVAQAAGCGPVFVVLGAGADFLRAEVALPDARVVVNLAWSEGIGSSVRAGVAAVEADAPDAGAILFTVCDQPLVTAGLLAELAAAHYAGRDLVAAAYAGTVGVPALFARRYFAELRELPGDAGAKRVLAGHASEVFAVPFPGGEADIDTPTDAARLAGGA